MTATSSPDRRSPSDIRTAKAENGSLRDRDLAAKLGLSEAQLLAVETGLGVTRIDAHPDRLIPALAGLGTVMALTRNDSCVIEKDGVYENYHSGEHAAMVLTEEIDLRLFPNHWVTAMAVERETETGVRRSIQVFDAAGEAVHKVHLREASNHAHWDTLVKALATGDLSQMLEVQPAKAPEPALEVPERADQLRAEWAEMTDTHQFLKLTRKLKMNRLGAYRVAGAPHARLLSPSCVTPMLEKVRDAGTEIMVFVGNAGCIEIHGGPIHTLKEMGPWQNVLDPGFNLHLRQDHIAEVWAVDKPTRRGPAISVEAFDDRGALIFQIFGRRTEAHDHRPEWNGIVADLPEAPVAATQGETV
ncbi:hemin-degrading factor [Chachezhania sediminis]|uniref:hemin-degrading factor n=1 Tax=Chachezhania sediminis TaxID=2599291 RepID=UPI00131B5E02|nr:ChuX/HutX family heme-like substrate-binding protein [Chachezhania sediminis]